MNPTDKAIARKAGLGLTLQEMTWVGKVFYKSGMFTDTTDEAKAIVKIMAGQEMGLAPFESMTGINIIKGRPTLSAATIGAKIKASNKYDYRVVVATELKNQIDFYEIVDGKRVKIGTSTYTIEQAKNAGLTSKENWRMYPEDMLFARNISRGSRRYTPDVFTSPIYTAEEIEDEPSMPLAYIPSSTPSKTLAEPQPVDEPPTEESTELDNEVAEAEPTPEPEPTLHIRDIIVDDAYKAEVTAELESLGFDDIEKKRFLKEHTGKLVTKNLTDAEWQRLHNAVLVYLEERGMDQIALQDMTEAE